MTIEDLFRIRLLGDPQISPDGNRILFVNKWIDPEKNKYFSNLWMVPFEGGEPAPFTVGDWNDSSPRWSPDGKWIAFISNRQKPKSQVYLIPTNGGEARPLTRLEEGTISEIVWSPDGTKLAMIYRETAPEWREEARKERQEKGFSNPPRVVTHAFYRLDGDGYFVDQRHHLYVVDISTGEAKQLTSGNIHQEHNPTWSPDSRFIAFISNRTPEPDMEPAMDDIWIIPASGGELKKVETPAGPKGALSWSPDGKLLAYAGHPYPDDSWGTRNVHVWVVPPEGGDARNLTPGLDNTVGVSTLTDVREFGGGDSLIWSRDSESLYFPVSERGSVHIYHVHANGTHLEPLTNGAMEHAAFSISNDNHRFAVLVGQLSEPHEVYRAIRHGNALTMERATALNQPFLNEVQILPTEEFEVPTPEGHAVHGWIVKPPDFNPNRTYPTILMIHGGPHAMYGNAFFFEFQLHAAEGYVIAYTNPRGSKGYGEAFAAAIKGDWGNRDYQDLMHVTDYLETLPYVDKTRLGVAGGSYGGYMTNWIVGHTDRFKTAITDRCVSNLISMGCTSDFPMIPGRYWDGEPWGNNTQLWNCSPFAYIANVKTPLLIVHSEGDLRCPIEQADQVFAALKRLGREVVYIRYPIESSHGLSRSGPPDLRADRLKRYLDWWEKYLKQ